jgi:2'-5' RNA ligase
VRAFIAIEIPDVVKAKLMALSEELRQCGVKASWVKPENMHLTLRFLGEVSDAQVNELRVRLRQCCVDTPSLDLSMKGVGVFPNPNRPRVLWAGVEAGDAVSLRQLQSQVEKAVRAVGLAPNNKAFHPHITLGRLSESRPSEPLLAALNRAEIFAGDDFHVGSVALFSSVLDKKGAVHTRIGTFTLT